MRLLDIRVVRVYVIQFVNGEYYLQLKGISLESQVLNHWAYYFETHVILRFDERDSDTRPGLAFWWSGHLSELKRG